MDYRLPIIILLLAGCTAPTVHPPTTTPPESATGVLVTVADYEGPLALRFELNGEPGLNCIRRQDWVSRMDGSGIDYMIIREGDPQHTYGGGSQHGDFVQVKDHVDTRRFNASSEASYSQITEGNHTMEANREVIALVFGHLEHAAEAQAPGVKTLVVGFDCHVPGSVKLLGAGTEVVPILFDRFNSTAAADLPVGIPFASERFMVEGRISATFMAPLVEVRLTGLAGNNDLARVTLTHPAGQEDWSVGIPFLNAAWSREFFGGPGTYTLDVTEGQAAPFWGAMMGFHPPEKLAMLNVTHAKVPPFVR